MITIISSTICKILLKYNNTLTNTDLLKINYVINVILNDILKLLIVGIIFTILDKTSLFILSLNILISLRLFIGGIHCKTSMSCLLVTILHFFITTIISQILININIIICIIFFIISIVLILIYAPCPNKKRPLKNKMILKILSLISFCFWIIVFFCTYTQRIRSCIFFSLVIQIIQIIINIKENHICKNL